MKIPERLTLEQFIENARKVHGDKYSYELIKEYKNNKEYLEIICPVHGIFKQKGGEHTTGGKGCDACSGKVKLTTEQFIDKAREVHGDRYDYSKTNYVNLRTPVVIICREHGEFEQIPRNHIYGKANCFKCGKEAMGLSKRRPLPDILETFKRIHGDKYEYVDIPTTQERQKILIRCQSHGIFEQILGDHIKGHGCTKCGGLVSKPQEEMVEYLSGLSLTTVQNYKLPSGKHIDIFLPELFLGIEYNGLRWHSEDFGRDKFYHYNKYKEAKEQGIFLLTIFEDEWLTQRHKIVNLFNQVSKKSNSSMFARDLKLDAAVPWAEAKELLDSVHIQSSGSPPTFGLGLRTNEGALVAFMGFSSNIVQKGEIELSRFATKDRVVGGFSRLLTHFLRLHGGYFNKIISFSDNRYSSGGVYELHKFSRVGETEPSYYWCKNQVERHHRRKFQKQYLEKMFDNYDPSKTEEENCRNNGYFKVWDCGLTKWELVMQK